MIEKRKDGFKENERDRIKWACPKCHYENDDEIDRELGPFLTVTCSRCGRAFGQHEV